jgi:hypothetical protein
VAPPVRDGGGYHWKKNGRNLSKYDRLCRCDIERGHASLSMKRASMKPSPAVSLRKRNPIGRGRAMACAEKEGPNA